MTSSNLTLIDAAQKEVAYRGLAQHYVASGDAWLALHAQVVADLASATLVLEQFELADAVNLTALEGAFTENTSIAEGKHPESALAGIRATLALALPVEVWDVWVARVGTSDLFGELTELSPDGVLELVAARVDGADVNDYIQARFQEATEKSELAREFQASSREWEAVVASYAADVATFEGWLFEHSLQVGDASCIQAEMRWALAVAALESIAQLPTDLVAATAMVRGRLAWALGPIDAPAFAARIQAL